MKLSPWEEFWQPLEGREIKGLKRLQGEDWHRAIAGAGKRVTVVLERLTVSDKGNYCGLYSFVKSGNSIMRPHLCYHWLSNTEVAKVQEALE